MKKSYVIKGNGSGRGTQFSHPRMDYLCLTKDAAKNMKRRCETRNSDMKVPTHFEYFTLDHFQIRG
jgi:hypothetical protein